MTEIWTATRKEPSNDPDNQYIIFKVQDETTDDIREERRYEKALPMMMALGGYPPIMAGVLLMQDLPWRFRKVGENIYIDGPSIDVDNYHPIG